MKSNLFVIILVLQLQSLQSNQTAVAIDWNFHMNLEAATTKAGEQIVTRKYNQRT